MPRHKMKFHIWINNKNQVSFHYAIDNQEVVQGLPIDRNAWACGRWSEWEMGIEKAFKSKSVTLNQVADVLIKPKKNAAHFIANLLRERGWGIEKVKKHQDFSNKYCPHRTLDKGWNGFIQMIKSYLNDVPTISSQGFKVGDQVKVKATATTYAQDKPSLHLLKAQFMKSFE